MSVLFGKLWKEDEGQDIAEYAVMLAVILVIVVGTVEARRIQRQQRFLKRREFVPIEPGPHLSLVIGPKGASCASFVVPT